MIFINHNNTNPYFNHAAEQYVLENIKDECFMLWRNEPCILVGRNQNAMAEVNGDYIREKGMKIVRRLTGGGAVFNDLGNINFTFIGRTSENVEENFRKFTKPIIEALNFLGVQAEFSGKNDLVIEGKKISGNAQYYYKDKVLHHGTLLFSVSMGELLKALKVNPLKFKDKAVKSVEARVTNINKYLNNMDVIEFKNYVVDYVMKCFGKKELYEFSEKELKKIDKIVENKFSTWKWNFGDSPKYNYSKEGRCGKNTIQVNLNVENGYIKEMKFYGDFFFKKDIKGLEYKFKEIKHEEKHVKQVLNNININEYINGVKNEEILELMF
ncbi:lipoate--protein ligase [Clostridium sporogenes]|uniref:lipoate--protein ligase n=1 Tax=Clostridium sporogenes TaxID=1509 RepID=UPI0006B29D0E|nr:lipoate--protein ligase [Clostridium sporogenes]KOY64703.1 lipoate--protein ligase [Clostridium sporogenes]MDS1007337.1 lipoate--protein ligase [Clostridium sporogenes]